MGTLGLAHLRSGDAASAIPWIERALAQAAAPAAGFTNMQMRGRFLAFLAEAQLALGRVDDARRSATRGLDLCRAIGFTLGGTLAEHTLAHLGVRS
jgi:hypothetical protein